MNARKDQRGSAMVVVLALVIVVLVVVLGIKFFAMKDDDTAKTSTGATVSTLNTQKASDLRTNLVVMGVEHMNLTQAAVADALDGSKSADASGAALYANGNDIGAAVGSIYGKDAETTFDSVWKLHLDQFVAYAVASSKGDEAGKTAALTAIDTGYTKPLSAYLAKANPNLPEKTLYTALSDHVQMTAVMIDDHVKGDYTAEQADLKEANMHIAELFSTLAGGIVKQYPDKFKD